MKSIFTVFFYISFVFTTYSQTAEELLLQGAKLEESGNYKKAVKKYTEAIKLKPNYGDAYYNRAIAKYLLEEFKESISDYSEAIRIRGNDSMAIYSRGVVYFEIGKHELALIDLNKSISYGHEIGSCYNYKAMVEMELGDSTKAIELYDLAIENDSLETLFYLNKATLLADLRMYNESITLYSKVLKMDPNSIDSFYNRGIQYYKTGAQRKACSDWKKAFKLGDTEVYEYINQYCK